ncbi:cobaltochelatase subunit CobN [Tepidiforma flava]|uniref:Cobaltochelatase subunit CobN n=1 Tax=Tepidiforma flava TaxID=3004094 RepID=A0ABY7M749_9CHLR|nr:cobaltochelatase subunit CobN [Tepidiforma flava]WBL36137.1 cobaltochelatase subunit CobN [Tepidiforma flava]
MTARGRADRHAHRGAVPGPAVCRDRAGSRTGDAVLGRSPGDIDTDGRDFLIRGAVLGNVAVVIQPDNGGYSDPIGLLYRDDASPSHSFTACYDWIRNGFGADVVLHFGTHGALEFMPGKQAGLLPTDFPDALIGDLPHVYYYCMNNPAEAAIARRRSASEIVSYLSPPVEASGLYGALEAARAAAAALRDDPGNPARAAELREAAAAAGLDAVADPSDCEAEPLAYLERVTRALDDLERTLIPLGLHVLGRGSIPMRRAASWPRHASIRCRARLDSRWWMN